MNPEINSEITDKERESASAALKAMAEVLDKVLNGKGTPQYQKQWGFALLVFPFDRIDAAHINYIGNGDRDGVHTAIKELASRWEVRHD